jgi:hypothetical protein
VCTLLGLWGSGAVNIVTVIFTSITCVSLMLLSSITMAGLFLWIVWSVIVHLIYNWVRSKGKWRLEFHVLPPDGSTTMRTLEFHRQSLDVRRRKYRKLCFLRRTVWACNMIQLYLRVWYETRNKARFFPHTALNDWFLKPCRGVFNARYGLSLYYNSVLFTCFVWISEQRAIVSHRAVIDWLLKHCRGVFIVRYGLSL